jgi:hypothetical protein
MKKFCVFFAYVLVLLALLGIFSSVPVMAEDNLLSTTAINTSAWPISEDQAIEIASGYLPAHVSESAVIDIGMGTVAEPGTDTRYIWGVVFSGVTITNQELGWKSGPDTWIDDSAEYSDNFQINIDAQTGETLFKLALRPGIRLAAPTVDDSLLNDSSQNVNIPWYLWLGISVLGLLLVTVIGYLAVKLKRQKALNSSRSF